MVEFDAFRQDLAATLLQCADRRRATSAEGQATGEDIKIIALLERLADDVKNLDLHVFLIFELMFTHKHLARRFLQDHEMLLAQVGVLYWPSSATDLVRWLTMHTVDDVRRQPLSKPKTPAAAAIRSSQVGTLHEVRGLLGTKTQPPFRSWASDFSGAFGIVAPALAFWEVRLAFGQLHEQSFIAKHAAVPASVVSVDHVSLGKSAGSTKTVVLAFQQPSGEACRVTWHSTSPSFTGTPGESLMVVPRSSACELPLIPSEVGSPTQTFALAAALMAGGLASLKLWTWLLRRAPRQNSPSKWFPSERRRHDFALRFDRGPAHPVRRRGH